MENGSVAPSPQHVSLLFGHTSVGYLIANEASLGFGQFSDIADLESTENWLEQRSRGKPTVPRILNKAHN